MLFMRSRLRWLRLPLAVAMALGLLLQAAQTASAAAPLPPLLAGSICHAGGDAPDDTPQPGTGHRHEHCQLCQFAAPAVIPPAPGPALPVRLAALFPVIDPPQLAVVARIRGPYAPRAPPAFGRSQT